MAQSKQTKKLFNMAYGLGASIVIVGALFKILHWELGPLNGGILLAIGLITEALIFAISAFEPVDDDLDWSLVYPELAGGMGKDRDKGSDDAEGILSKKLDEMLKDAQIDAELMGSLSDSIRSFEDVAKVMSPTEEALNSTKKYSEQAESANRQNEVNNQVLENAEQMKNQMENLATNLSSLNGVYGGMLSAMEGKN